MATEAPPGGEAESGESDPRPTDPQFQFLMLLVARKAGDEMLESLAREWLAEAGIRVVFDGDPAGSAVEEGVVDAA